MQLYGIAKHKHLLYGIAKHRHLLYGIAKHKHSLYGIPDDLYVEAENIGYGQQRC